MQNIRVYLIGGEEAHAMVRFLGVSRREEAKFGSMTMILSVGLVNKE